MFVEGDDPVFGRVKLPATPLRFSATTTAHGEPPPLIGQHTAEVLKTLAGVSDGEIAELVKNKVI